VQSCWQKLSASFGVQPIQFNGSAFILACPVATRLFFTKKIKYNTGGASFSTVRHCNVMPFDAMWLGSGSDTCVKLQAVQYYR